MNTETLVRMIRRGAALDPTKTAVRSSGGELAFAQLVDGAGRIATALAEAGVARGDRVGIWMDKTPACVQAVVGTMMAGAAYVPLDPKAPWRRCQSILADCGVAAVFADGPRLAQLADLLAGLAPRLLVVDGDPGAVGAAPGMATTTLGEVLARPGRELPEPGLDDLAYILYTSGSTGTPKGVVHTHRSGADFVCWVRDTYGITADDVFSSHAPFHFDLSVCDLYVPLGCGATVRLISSLEAMLPPYLVRSVAEWGITVWYSVPSILIAMMETGGLETAGFGQVRILFFAGEVFPAPQLQRLRRALPGVRMANLFGPTETNVCTYYDLPPDVPADRPIPIGKACENLESFVLDDDGREIGVGVEGTLWIKGGNLMSGYWNDPERTALTLKPDPRGGDGVAYCTGDRVRLQPDGDYEFLGRRDHMIKIRGFRIDTGEVEAALAAQPAVLEAVVVAVAGGEAGTRLAASVVPRAGAGVDVNELRAFCADRLPVYMVPELIEVRDALPRTSTGKADRKALQAAWSQEGNA
ncbi:MAG: amino acid adenylation domain-containing protein [Krumholzibacteria bacterium]|nr:amino acid adenylation domain-containing protein [Candidatus Krumholzibacteria bacterium]